MFTKGIVRGYCKVLGLPEHQWMDRLAVSWEQAAPEPDWTEFAQAVKRNRVQTSPIVRRRWWGVAGMLLALLMLTWAAWHYVLRDRSALQLRLARERPSLLKAHRFPLLDLAQSASRPSTLVNGGFV